MPRPAIVAAAAAVTLACCSPAAAQLVTADHPVFGPDSLVIDESQGLAFLRLDETFQADQATIDLIEGEGFRLATTAEAITVLNNSGMSPQAVVSSALTSSNVTQQSFTTASDLFGAFNIFNVIFVAGAETAEGLFVGIVQDSAFGPIPIYRVLGGTTYGGEDGRWYVIDAAPEPVTTYQGSLTDDGSPVNGQADFRVTLVDRIGAPVGSPVEHLGVEVAGGVFTLDLPFPAGDLSRADVLLSIEAAFPAGSPYVTLDPAQPVAPAPRALAADTADIAANVLSSSTLIPLASPLISYGAGYEPPTVSRQGNVVSIKGLVRDGSGAALGSGDVIGLLPEAYRPNGRNIFLMQGSFGSYRVDVLADGQIVMGSSPQSSPNPSWVSLSGINYSVE